MADKQTLRDTFAAAALTGLLAGRQGRIDGLKESEAAHKAGAYADAMLRERGAAAAHTPTLTDAEREAVWSAIEHGEDATVSGLPPLWTAALRQLLARLGGER